MGTCYRGSFRRFHEGKPCPAMTSRPHWRGRRGLKRISVMHLDSHHRVLAVFALCLICFVPSRASATEYPLGPDSNVQPGVPQGKVTQHKWTSNKVFPGTERDYWVYVPAQYDGSQPACVMVFQDGGGFVKPDGESRATVVMDNLIHKKE